MQIKSKIVLKRGRKQRDTRKAVKRDRVWAKERKQKQSKKRKEDSEKEKLQLELRLEYLCSTKPI